MAEKGTFAGKFYHMTGAGCNILKVPYYMWRTFQILMQEFLWF